MIQYILVDEANKEVVRNETTGELVTFTDYSKALEECRGNETVYAPVPKKSFLYSIIDNYSETVGIIASNAESDKLYEIWKKLCEEDKEIEDLEQELKAQGFTAERVFTEDIYV